MEIFDVATALGHGMLALFTGAEPVGMVREGDEARLNRRDG
jgi:hypothetical protein